MARHRTASMPVATRSASAVPSRPSQPLIAASGQVSDEPLCQNLPPATTVPEDLWPEVGGWLEIEMSGEKIKHVSDASFDDDVLQSDRPVLVDYWAEWCGPCRMIAPILEEVSQDYGERLQVAKMNVDENQQVPARFGIRGIPTLMLFKGGQLVATKVGALPKAQLTAFIDGHL